MSIFGEHIKIDPRRYEYIELCGAGAPAFTPDESEAWLIQQLDNGRDLDIDFIDFDNQNYDGTSLFNDRQVGDGFPVKYGSAVDSDYNLYVVTGDSPKLHKYTRSPLAHDYEVSVGTPFELKGCAYVHHRDEVWIRSNDQNGFLFVRNPSDGAMIKDISDIGSVVSEGMIYSHVTEKLYWPRLSAGDEQFDIIEYNPDTETKTEHVDLLPATPNMNNSIAPNSWTIDFEGNHWLTYITDDTTSPVKIALLKFDKGFNLLMSFDVSQWAGTALNPVTLISVDPFKDIYLTEDRDTEVFMNRFTTDDDGLNPVHAWRLMVHQSPTLSPGFTDIQAERSASGRILSIHSRSGGFRATKKDGSSSKMVFSAKPGKNIIVLPGEIYSVK